MEENSVQNEMT